MQTRLLCAAATALALAAGCGGSASAGGTSGHAGVSSHGGTTSVTGSGAGHSFAAQISSLGALLDRVSRMSGSTGSNEAATTLGGLRNGLGAARSRLAATSFPSVVQSQKHQLLSALRRWDGDLAQAQRSARDGNTVQALHQARSATYRDLKALLDVVTAAGTL